VRKALAGTACRIVAREIPDKSGREHNGIIGRKMGTISPNGMKTAEMILNTGTKKGRSSGQERTARKGPAAFVTFALIDSPKHHNKFSKQNYFVS